MAQYVKESSLRASTTQLYHYHCNPGAFTRLTPAWEPCQLLEPDDGIREGDVRTLKIGPGPLSLTWKAVHEEFVENKQFVDRQQAGPFKSWRHLHEFRPGPEPETATLSDQIAFQLPLGLPFGGLLKPKLERMFAYRHRQTARDLTLINRYKGPNSQKTGPSLKIGITGSSGFVGSSLSSFLGVAGHRVVPLKRGYSVGQSEASIWWPEPDLQGLEGLDAVVHLAGEPVAQLWTKSARERILFSRAEGTRRLCEALSRLEAPPKVLISGSATGYYPQRSDGPVRETSAPGGDFLSEVCQEWEKATVTAEKAGIRVCHLRTGLVVGRGGGFLAAQLPAFQLGMGAVLGDGEQMQPFVDLDDLVGAIYHLLNSKELHGPFNGTAPHPISQRVFAENLASSLGRPLWLTVPERPVRWILGEQANMFFTGVEAVPCRLLDSGYQFLAPTLEASFSHHLGLGSKRQRVSS